MRRLYVVLILLATVIACDSKSPIAPTGPSPAPTPTPAAAQVAELTIAGNPTFTALGQVRQFAATARMTDGSERDVTAEAEWLSTNLPVVSVSRTGQAVAVSLGFASISASYEKGASLDVAVMPSGDSSRISGPYRLVVTAAPVCTTLPDSARHREYEATITQPNDESSRGPTELTLTVRVEPGSTPQFNGRIDGSSVSFSFPGGDGGGGFFYYYYYSPPGVPPPFSYSIDTTSLYTLTGEARGTKGSTRAVQIRGTINGAVSVVEGSSAVPLVECSSAKHQFSLVRQ